MDPSELASLIDRTCRLTGTFTLRSGQIATEYFDKYLFESQPQILRVVSQEMVPLLPTETEVLGGLELGGIPLATMVSSLTGLPAVFVRKTAKEYGTRRLAEGLDVASRTVTIIEDVLTTGGAARHATLALRSLGAAVSVAVCAIDRSDRPDGPLTDVDVQTRAVLTKADLDHGWAALQRERRCVFSPRMSRVPLRRPLWATSAPAACRTAGPGIVAVGVTPRRAGQGPNLGHQGPSTR